MNSRGFVRPLVCHSSSCPRDAQIGRDTLKPEQMIAHFNWAAVSPRHWDTLRSILRDFSPDAGGSSTSAAVRVDLDPRQVLEESRIARDCIDSSGIVRFFGHSVVPNSEEGWLGSNAVSPQNVEFRGFAPLNPGHTESSQVSFGTTDISTHTLPT